jgi:hypothetical protein
MLAIYLLTFGLDGLSIDESGVLRSPTIIVSGPRHIKYITSKNSSTLHG